MTELATGIPPPPRLTGNSGVDISLLIEYLWQLFKVIGQQGAFIRTAGQFSAGDFDPSSLPDPASATIASAQQTANEAYTLAVIARITFIQAGTVTISDANTTGTLTFDDEQADADYFVSHTPSAFTGAPSLNATQIISISKATTGFTITVNTAPGLGNSVTFDLIAMRNPT